MGIKIFRDGSWNRITDGVISRRDIMYLDAEKDRELIRYLAVHAPEQCRRSVMRYALEKYGMNELPEPRKNTDDPDDPYYEEYFVLREQVVLEDDRDVLKEAALHSMNYNMAAFAFCRLTGYSFSPGECDAFTYRTFSCGIMPEMTAEDIREFCRMMVREKGRFADAASGLLERMSDNGYRPENGY